MIHVPQSAGDHAAIAQAVEKQQNEERLKSCRGSVHKFMREVARAEPGRADEPRIVDHRTLPGGPRQQITPTGMMRCQLCHGRATPEQVEWYVRGVQAGVAIEPPARKRSAPLAFDEGLGGRKGIV